MWLRFLAFPLALAAGVAAAAVSRCLGLVVVLAYPNLPELDALTDYQPKMPLRIYTADGVLIGEFGEERRAVVAIADVPPQLKQAIIAAEDERFYQHAGIDYIGVLRAAYANLVSGGRRQGASTITMQVARNFFLSSEKTLTRKLYEVLLAFKIEHSLTKEQILELYVNQIYLGPARLRLRRRLADLLRQAARPAERSPRPRCSPACRRRRRPTTRSPTRSGPSSASSTCCAA